MSGRHAVVKPRTRPDLLKPLRTLWTKLADGWWRLAIGAGDAFTRLGERFDTRTDAFWATSTTAPPASDAAEPAAPAVEAVQEPAPEPEPLHLTPERALRALHEQRRDLPGHLLQWRTTDTTVHGAVSSLDCNPDEQREVVEFYAGVLLSGITEHATEDGHVTVSTTASFAGATIVVSAVLLNGDTIPLRVYEEAAGDETLDDTLTTQLIPPSVLEQVMS